MGFANHGEGMANGSEAMRGKNYYGLRVLLLILTSRGASDYLMLHEWRCAVFRFAPREGCDSASH